MSANDNYTERKSGVVAGFLGCSDEYLELIRTDLGLGCRPEDMKQLQALWRKRGTDPTVADLYFDTASIAISCRASGAERLSSCRGDWAMNELLEDLVRRYVRDHAVPGTAPAAPSLPALAGYAAAGPDGRTEYVGYEISVTREDAPECPLPGAAAPALAPAFVSAGGYLVTVFPGDPAPCRGMADGMGALLMPGEGQDVRSFIRAVHSLVSLFRSEDCELFCVPCTDRGLLRDIAAAIPGGFINCEAIPGDNRFPECALESRAPGMLVFLPRSRVPQAAAEAARLGLGFSIAVPAIRPAAEGFTVSVPGCAPVSVNAERLRACDYIRPLDLTPSPAPLEGRGDLDTAAPPQLPLCSARELSGTPYEALKDSMKGGGVYAVTGTLDPSDPGALPLILALDAFRRNEKPCVAAARFFRGDRCTLTVFRLDGKL